MTTPLQLIQQINDKYYHFKRLRKGRNDIEFGKWSHDFNTELRVLIAGKIELANNEENKNPTKLNDLGKSGLCQIEKNYRWDELSNKLITMFEGLIK